MMLIQVTEETAGILKSKGYILTCRGAISVKGKGEQINNYSVCLYFIYPSKELCSKMAPGEVGVSLL